MRRRPVLGTAAGPDALVSDPRVERVGWFGTRYGGGLVTIRQDDGERRTIVELHRLDDAVTVRVPTAEQRTAGLARRNPGPDNRVRAENITAYALTTRPTVRLSDSVSAVELTPRQARSLARELEQAARAAELLESGAMSAPTAAYDVTEFYVGQPDPTGCHHALDRCQAIYPGSGWVCTWRKGHPERLHVAGDGEKILSAWTDAAALRVEAELAENVGNSMIAAKLYERADELDRADG